MKTTGLFFFCCCCSVCCWLLPPASGVPLQPSSERVVAFVGENVTLPCCSTPRPRPPQFNPPPDMVVEWSFLKGKSWVTVLVSRGGKELPKEKSAEYLGRTAEKNGSLILFSVQLQDNGTYRCNLVRGSEKEKENANVTLLVVQLPEVNFSVNRTEANQLMVYCESSGWRQKPDVSVRDLDGKSLAVHTEFPDQDDGLHAVRTLVKEGNGTFICRVEIPGENVMNKNKISVSDEFIPLQKGPDSSGSYLWVGGVAVTVVLIVAFVAICRRLKLIDWLRLKLIDWLQLKLIDWLRLKLIDWLRLKLIDWLQMKPSPAGDGIYNEFGDINKIQTSGASENTMMEAQPEGTVIGGVLSGVEASNELAKRHLNEMQKYRRTIMTVGRRLKIHPCLIAGIISRQSEAGKGLQEDGDSKGYGKQDSNCFGLMQINKKYHAVKGGPYSEEHLDHGVTILIQSIKTMAREKGHWSKEEQLKGALACYIAGEPNVMGSENSEDVDSRTPNGDFANDVIARAQWFVRNHFI